MKKPLLIVKRAFCLNGCRVRLILIELVAFATALFAQSPDSSKVITPRDSVFALLDTTETCTSKFGTDTTKWNNCINLDLQWSSRYCTYKKGKISGPAWDYFEYEGSSYSTFFLYKNEKFQYSISYANNGFIDEIDYGNKKIYYGGRKVPFTGRDSIFVNDTLYSSAEYENGIRNGYAIYYYPNGKISIEKEYKKGVQDGPESHYRESGQIWWETSYKNGKEVGVSKEYYADGSIHWIYPYVNGNMDGVVKGYYKNGQLMITQTYKKGKQEGKQTEYSVKTGKVISTAIFKNGELVGDKKCSDGRFGSNDLDCTPLNE